MKARVTVTLKTGILDPQGKAIEGALKSLGVDGVASVRQGKVFDIELSGSDKAKAEATLKAAADKLLANTVIENFPESTASATWRARSGSRQATSLPWSGMPIHRCRKALISWWCQADFPTATTCGAAPSPRARL